MTDIFQFFTGSADAAPGKGTGETLVSSPDVYKALKGVKGWRKGLASGDPTLLEQILPLTHSAQLWEAPLKKPKIRRTDLEEKRTGLLSSLKQNGNVVEQSEEMSAPPRKLPPKRSEVQAAAAASGAAAAGGGGEAGAAAPAAAPKAPAKPRGPPRRSNAARGAAVAATIGVGDVQQAAGAAGGAAAAPARPRLPVAANIGIVPEAILAGAEVEPALDFEEPPDMDAPEANKSSMRFCPVCRYYLYLQIDNPSAHDPSEQSLKRICRNCGFNEKDEQGGLLSEILVQERSSEGYKILVNEFTHLDPCNPHIRGVLKCPNSDCQSNLDAGRESDIIYLQYDKVNLLYIYICNLCQTRWHSRR